MIVAEIRRCVVCGKALVAGQERYANSWEASVGERACCSEPCVGAFDADRDWMPSQKPPSLGEDEEHRLLTGGKERLARGDKPALVARDLLLAGSSLGW